jgi:hypothetical protein
MVDKVDFTLILRVDHRLLCVHIRHWSERGANHVRVWNGDSACSCVTLAILEKQFRNSRGP